LDERAAKSKFVAQSRPVESFCIEYIAAAFSLNIRHMVFISRISPPLGHSAGGLHVFIENINLKVYINKEPSK